MPTYTIYNFPVGPAVLSETMLRVAQQEMFDYNGIGFPVMAMSHRLNMFLSILHHIEHDLRRLLNIPLHYKVLFLQGGTATQLNVVIMNLARGFKCADAVATSNWNYIAYEQMSRLIDVEIHLTADDGEQFGYTTLPAVESWDVDKHSAFIYFAINGTMHDLQYQSVLELPDGLPSLMRDVSNEILSCESDVNDCDLVYTGAQRNIGPAGAAIVITCEDLLERHPKDIPDVFSYQSHIERNGMYNMPAIYPIYTAGLVFRWLLTQGDVKKIESVSNLKAEMLYRTTDGNGGFYVNNIQVDVCLKMNIIFKISDPGLDDTFAREAEPRGLCVLKGYKLPGGMCASIYNVMSSEDVEALAAFMQDFQRRYG